MPNIIFIYLQRVDFSITFIVVLQNFCILIITMIFDVSFALKLSNEYEKSKWEGNTLPHWRLANVWNIPPILEDRRRRVEEYAYRIFVVAQSAHMKLQVFQVEWRYVLDASYWRKVLVHLNICVKVLME